MMITSTERRALSALEWVESRPSCASGLITSLVNRPTVAIRSPVSTPRVRQVYPTLMIGGGSGQLATLSLKSHPIQSP
jgi:hypothetical protein